jgi:YYY domain-containing protein
MDRRMDTPAQDIPLSQERPPLYLRAAERFRRLWTWNPRTLYPLPEIVLVALILVGVGFRFTGNNWSEGTALNPDELGLNNVVSGIRMPSTIDEYFNTRISTVSPYLKYDAEGNTIGQGPDAGWVWGQWPVILIRATAEGLNSLQQAALPAVNGILCPDSAGASPAEDACQGAAFVDYTAYGRIRLLGRFLSALTDTITILVILAIGLRLYNRRIALLGAAFSALAVTQIQQSHFMTIDNFGVMFAALAMYCAVRAAQAGGFRWYALFGCWYGMTLASRPNFAPLGAMILVAAIIGQRECWRDGEQSPLRRLGPPLAMFLLAVAVTVLTFRIAQPMAFRAETGDTGFFTLSLNPDWISRMKYASTLSSGTGYVSGYPPAEHWANRPAIVTPLLSIVLWGMGLPLGLAAFAGLGWAAYRVYRGREWARHILPVLFAGGMFLFLGTRWVKEMRYFLVIYPFLCLLAAWALAELWALAAEKGRWWRGIAGLAIGAVLVGTLAWAWRFSEIYRSENTRLEASRWIFQNFPAAFRLTIRLPAGETFQQGVNFYNQEIGPDAVRMNFTAAENGTVEAISLGHVLDLSGADESRIHLALFSEPPGPEPLAETDLIVPPPGKDPRGSGAIAYFGPAALEQGREYTLYARAAAGGPFTATGAWFVDEDWDEPLPFNLDGFSADLMFQRWDATRMNIEWPDVEEKRQMLIDNLDRADYVIIQSQRRIWSVCRMPAVYPMTMEYYRALFDGRLGFELVQTFQHPFAFGPLVVSDLAGSVSWNAEPELPMFNLNPLAAEESFSVYDHAPVWIFKKMDGYSTADVESILNAVNLDRTVNQDASLSFGMLHGLMLTKEQLAEQEAGGTWSEMFSYEWVWNKYPGLAAAMWWIWALLTGWAALPIVSFVFRGLPDEGYTIAKFAGWLLVSWAAWLLGCAEIPFVWTTIALLWLALAAAGGFLLWRDRAQWREKFRRLWKTWLAAEILFAVLFVFFLLIRLGNSDLWHPSKGGEKPMNMSYLYAVIKSTSFPPYDPWFGGGYMNYYYFGYVLIAIPVKLLGTVPTIAYNIGLAMLFATIGVTAHGVAWNLAESLRRKGASKVSPWAAGLGAAVMIVVLGNLGEVKLVWDGLTAMSSLEYPRGLLFGLGDIPHLVVGGLRYALGQATWPFGFDNWYWNASRSIPVPLGTDGGPTEVGPITEFPFFSFLYADLHAHSLALPSMLLALAGSAAMILSPQRLRRWKTALPLVGITALAVGSLWPINSWNYPISLLIALAGLALAGWRMLAEKGELKDGRGWVHILLLAGLLVGLSVVLFQPYRQWYAAGYTSVQQWKGSKTPLDAYFMIHGLFLFILVSYVIWLTRESLRSVTLVECRKYVPAVSAVLLAASALAAGLVILGALGYAVLVFCIPLILWAVLLGLRGSLADEHRIVLGLLAAALAATCGVEVIVLSGDIDRMNTVFKFYIQAWTFFAVAAGIALGWLAGEAASWKRTPRALWFGALALLGVGGLLYTVEGSIHKIEDRMSQDAPQTLDGMTYMYTSTYWDLGEMTLDEDYFAIRWMQDNVPGSPVIVEGSAPEYRWGNRFTIYTGLPAVVGWNFHQRQQRGTVDDQLVWDRVYAVADFYNTEDVEAAMAFLNRYNVRYIVVGQMERIYYSPEGLAKFEQMVREGRLRAVFTTGQTVIYEVLS